MGCKRPTLERHRETLGVVKSATISKAPTGKFLVSLLCDTGEDCRPKAKVPKETTVGIDLGIKDFLVTSSGEVIANPKYLRNDVSGTDTKTRNELPALVGVPTSEAQPIGAAVGG